MSSSYKVTKKNKEPVTRGPCSPSPETRGVTSASLNMNYLHMHLVTWGLGDRLDKLWAVMLPVKKLHTFVHVASIRKVINSVGNLRCHGAHSTSDIVTYSYQPVSRRRVSFMYTSHVG